MTAISQTMVSRIITHYTELIVEHLAPRYIQFPQTEREIDLCKAKYEEKYNFPGIIGIIDGTHILIAGLSRRTEAAYVNRKGFHSINAQIVCDSDLRITNINARYPGSNHDSFIYTNSQVFTFLRQYHRDHPEENVWLLGNNDHKISYSNNLGKKRLFQVILLTSLVHG